MAGLVLEEEKIPCLAQLGVRDSKLLTRRSRNFLAPKIIDLAERHLLLEIEPQEIDSVVLRGRPMMRLNQLEARYAAKLLSKLKADTVYVDAPDRSPERFACQILQRLRAPTRIVSEHHADRKYPIVSAASILAKARRDEIVLELHKTYGNFGSGYPSDLKTTEFVRRWLRKNRCNLPIVRRTWKTFRNLEL
jgi:ribonuclease HII